MPNVLEITDRAEIAEEESESLTAEEETYERTRYASTGDAPDLSNGGMVNGVRVRPARDKNVTKGRPNARKAWMWNGTESLLPLAWDTDGRIHDGAKRYFDKRYCLCCRGGTFKGRQCPYCVRNACIHCQSSTDKKKIIPCFYRTQESVPFPSKRYGSIACFLAICPRQGNQGFLAEEDMRLHARLMHKMEYQAHVESLAASKTDEITELRKRLDDLMASMAQGKAPDFAVISKADIPKPVKTEGARRAQQKYTARLKAAKEARAKMAEETRQQKIAAAMAARDPPPAS